MNRGRNIVITSLAMVLSMTMSLSAFGQADQKQLNLFEEHKDEYVQPKDPELVEVGPAHYLVIEGASAPEGAAFQKGIGALYAVAFTMKAARAKGGLNYAISPAEGQWWVEDKEFESFLDAPREQWHWKLLMRVPDSITKAHLDEAIAACEGRNESPPHEEVKLKTIEEGLCVQLFHAGPYAEERPNIERMHAFMTEHGLVANGLHHEIYLNNPQQVPPEKLKTILRQPVMKKKAVGNRQ